jgi:hypothetical protein
MVGIVRELKENQHDVGTDHETGKYGTAFVLVKEAKIGSVSAHR